MSRSFHRGPWSGKVDLVICRSMGIINEVGDGIISFQTIQGNVWNPQEALVLHAPQIRPPPLYQYQHHGDPGESSSQGGCFPNFQSLHDLLQENLLCTRNTYNMASNMYARVGIIERNISEIQDDMAGQGGDDEDDDMD
ncbi:hypothetical protein HanRHA438_Chr02g0079241 [Helianthus annuus]|nr:hypothetical protein HanRHA438_Chr02g0079241 [Helianthus annuus]